MQLSRSSILEVHRANQCPKLGGDELNADMPQRPNLTPTETFAAQDLRSAKALFVPSLKRDIVLSIACTQPPAGGVAWQSTSDGENSFSHWAARQWRGIALHRF